LIAKARQSNFSPASLPPIGRRRVHRGRISNQLKRIPLLCAVVLLPFGSSKCVDDRKIDVSKKRTDEGVEAEEKRSRALSEINADPCPLAHHSSNHSTGVNSFSLPQHPCSSALTAKPDRSNCRWRCSTRLWRFSRRLEAVSTKFR
jgi:hypothetical protein